MIASSMASMAWSRTSASRMAARSALRSMYVVEARSPVDPALLRPAALPSLDHDRTVGRDAVATA